MTDMEKYSKWNKNALELEISGGNFNVFIISKITITHIKLNYFSRS
jgi:hypothetical protein